MLLQTEMKNFQISFLCHLLFLLPSILPLPPHFRSTSKNHVFQLNIPFDTLALSMFAEHLLNTRAFKRPPYRRAYTLVLHPPVLPSQQQLHCPPPAHLPTDSSAFFSISRSSAQTLFPPETRSDIQISGGQPGQIRQKC